MSEAVVLGDGSRLALRISARAQPHAPSDDDANWLVGEAELHDVRDGATFHAFRPVSVRTMELAAFHGQLVELLRTLNGEAQLNTVEDAVSCAIRLRKGKGEFSATIRQHPGVELRVDGVPTDQSFLQETAAALASLLDDFPVIRASRRGRS